MAIVTIVSTIQVDTDEAGIDIYKDEENPTEDNVCDRVYSYFAEHPNELADLILEQLDSKQEHNYQDVVEIEFEEWG